jgi:hypothetical protein
MKGAIAAFVGAIRFGKPKRHFFVTGDEEGPAVNGTQVAPLGA